MLVDAIHTPGHTAGMLNFTVDGHVFTGDTLFKHSIGGVRAPGSTSYEDIKHSIMEELMTLDHDTESCTPATPTRRRSATSGSTTRSSASGAASTPRATSRSPSWATPRRSIVWGDDYDGGHKAWVRWADGRDDIVPGSKVERSA